MPPQLCCSKQRVAGRGSQAQPVRSRGEKEKKQTYGVTADAEIQATACLTGKEHKALEAHLLP